MAVPYTRRLAEGARSGAAGWQMLYTTGSSYAVVRNVLTTNDQAAAFAAPITFAIFAGARALPAIFWTIQAHPRGSMALETRIPLNPHEQLSVEVTAGIPYVYILVAGYVFTS